MPSIAARARPVRLVVAGLVALAALIALGLATRGNDVHQRDRAQGVVSLDAHAGAAKPPPNATASAGETDSEAGQSFAQTRQQAGHHALAAAPGTASAATAVSPGAPTDAEVRRELKQLETGGAAGTVAGPRAVVDKDGMAHAPRNAPPAVARMIAAGNEIAKFPYIWGGGHGSFVDNGYDCSGSVSYVLAAGGFLSSPLTSGDLAGWGKSGPGKWVTVFANGGHTYMYVAGLRFDTSGRSGPLGTRWQAAARSNAGFAARHPHGL